MTTSVSGGAQPALTTPTGFEFRKLQHVDYQGTDSHIHELWFDSNGWHDNDLTNGPVVSVGPLTARVFASIATQHVVFRGSGGSPIHELWWDNSGWHHNDLIRRAPDALMAGGDPTGYEFIPNVGQGSQHVIYASRDHHVIELKWTP